MSLDIEQQRSVVVRGTEVLPGDTSRGHREKLARLTLDAMRRFAGLLDTRGNVVEVNQGALDAVGLQFADVEGKPLWTTVWWQASPEANQGLRDAFARALRGEAVQWETEICCSADGRETFAAEASLVPVTDDDGVIVFIAVETRDITQAKAQEREVAQKNVELQGLLERIRELDEVKTHLFANVGRELRTPLGLILGPAQSLVDDDGTTLAWRSGARTRSSSRATRACCSSRSTTCSTCRSSRQASSRSTCRTPTSPACCASWVRTSPHWRPNATSTTRSRRRHSASPPPTPTSCSAWSRTCWATPSSSRRATAACAARCSSGPANSRSRSTTPARVCRRTCARRSSSASASSTAISPTAAHAPAGPDSAWPSPGSSSRCTRAAWRCATPGSAARASKS